MQTSSRADGEVAPDVGARTEVELLDGTGRRLETRVWILSRDTNSDDVALGTRLALVLLRIGIGHVKVDLRAAVWSDSVEHPDVANAMEGDTHSYLKLRSGKVDAGNNLSRWMLDLKTRVKFEEVEVIFCVAVEIFGAK